LNLVDDENLLLKKFCKDQNFDLKAVIFVLSRVFGKVHFSLLGRIVDWKELQMVKSFAILI